jgi:predicted transposase YdaD
MMRESVIFQEIWREAWREGWREGRQEEGRLIVLRLLNRKVGILSEELLFQVDSLSLEQLESLAEALLEFASIADLENWLNPYQS